jgi:formylglycine-generating enzyme required for sulfatase activity
MTRLYGFLAIASLSGFISACSDDTSNGASSSGESSSGLDPSQGASSGTSGTSGSSGTSGTSSGSSGDPGPVACKNPPCANGESCVTNNDCTSKSCVANLCAPPSCSDQIKNGDETDTDCGGSCATKCAPTKACTEAKDCLEGVCTASVCAAATKSDEVKNGNETDVDCGSSTPGGADTSAPACDAGKSCLTAADCKSGGCNHLGKCAWARSCTPQRGGTTCGTGDSTRANDHEDCCTSVDVPAYADVEGYSNPTGFRLDKYQITSGRIRRFLDAVNGNVKTWVQTNRANINAPAQLPDTLDKYLPTGFTQPNSTDDCKPVTTEPSFKCNYGALNQVSGYRYTNEPGGDAGYACYMGQGAYGTRTFYLTNAELAQVDIGETQHVVPRERVEEKAMTCATYVILAAFCAWDGGRLETWDEYNAAVGGNRDMNGTGTGRIYPWMVNSGVFPDPSRSIGFGDSGSDVVGPKDNYGYTPPAPPAGTDRYSVFNTNLTPQQKTDLLLRLNRANHSWNYANAFIRDYIAPLEGRAANPILAEAMINDANDQSIAVAPPGRYPLGAGRYGHRDLSGNVMEITATPNSGVLNASAKPRWTRNGSFETSHYNAATMLGNSSYNFSVLAKYGRAGGRCARPAGGYPVQPLPEGN